MWKKGKGRKGLYIRSVCILGLFLCLFVHGAPVRAMERPGKGRLIQTTTPREEYLALVHLDLLRTRVNDNGDTAQSIQNVRASVTQIRSGEYWGSGVILQIGEDEVIIVSNRHLLRHQEFSRVRFYNGMEGAGRRLFLSEKYDMGLLQVDISGWDYEARSRLRKAAMDPDCLEELQSGDIMFVVGSTEGPAQDIYEGTVADPWYYFEEFGSYMIYNYCRGKGGMSGGGTYDEHGHYIGMITGGHDEETASLPVSLILEEAEGFLDLPFSN